LTVYLANTQFKKILKIQWGEFEFEPPSPPLGTPVVRVLVPCRTSTDNFYS